MTQGTTSLLGAQKRGEDQPGGVINANYGGTEQDGEEKERKKTKTTDPPEEEERQQWSGPIEFLLACIATSVGLGNIWRFPTTAFENGGGAFLLPYLLVLIFIGRPLYFLELVMGQFSSAGNVGVWKMVPAMKGIGYGQMCATWTVVTYYSYLMGITVFYMAMSFSEVLPWSVCDDAWADENCVDAISTNYTKNSSTNYQSSSEQYYYNYVLHMKMDITDGIGLPDWKLTLCLLFSWTALFLTLGWGVKSTGKVVYFTALFPYAVLISLLIRGAMLPGATDGMLYYITPEWERLLDPSVWFAAVTQAFFSLGTGFGAIIHLASYNNFFHNVYRDAWIISLLDTFTSLLAGFTIFSILGNLAFQLNTEIDHVVRSGNGLAFVSYPDALAKFTWAPQLFAVLFFLMLFTLCLGSIQTLTGSIITILADQFPATNKFGIALAVCIASFLVSLFYTTPGGQWILSLMDYFGGSFVIFVLAFFETVTIVGIYGLKNILRDAKFMLKIELGIYWKFCWCFCPLALLAIFTYSMIFLELPTVGDMELPDTAYACGWGLAAFAVSMVPIFLLHSLCHAKGETFLEKVKSVFKPADDWGPKKEVHRKEWEKLFK